MGRSRSLLILSILFTLSEISNLKSQMMEKPWRSDR